MIINSFDLGHKTLQCNLCGRTEEWKEYNKNYELNKKYFPYDSPSGALNKGWIATTSYRRGMGIVNIILCHKCVGGVE